MTGHLFSSFSLSTTKLVKPETQRILRLTVEYDGTDFAGFQLQEPGIRSVQGDLETAIAQASGQPCRIHGAGRTDAGVHATGQVVHFATDWRIPGDKVAIALNSGKLPRDLVVRESAEAPPGFHARFSATARTYRYVILNRPAPSALLGRFALHVRPPLDLAAMRGVAAELTGVRDWAAFGHPAQPGQSTIRQVEKVTVLPWKDCVLVTVKGNAFLRQMVRAFVGTLVLAGDGKLTPAKVRAIRESRDRSRCRYVAPPQGLCLVRVEYDGKRQTFGQDETNDTEETESAG